MEILLINQFFWPDSAATSQFLTDLARELSMRGHHVTVLCGGGKAYAKKDSSARPDVRIRRSLSLPFGRSKPMRLLSYVSFLTTAGLLGLTGRKPDLVITLTTPPLVGLIGTMLKLVRGVRHVSWEMDLYPDVICDLGYCSRKNLFIRMVGAMADFYRRHADSIIALGTCMERRLIERGILREKIRVSENWADGSVIQPFPFPPGQPYKILYSGNLGLGHDVDTVAETMLALKDDPRFHFTFSGGGGRRAALEQFCTEKTVSAVSFQSYCAREELGWSLGNCHIGLVTQNKNCSGSIVPSKTYGILAAGRPLLYIGPADSTPALLVKQFQCGWHINCGDTAGLVALLRRLAESPDEIHRAGKAARAAFDLHYERRIGLSNIYESLLSEKRPVEVGAAIAPHVIPKPLQSKPLQSKPLQSNPLQSNPGIEP